MIPGSGLYAIWEGLNYKTVSIIKTKFLQISFSEFFQPSGILNRRATGYSAARVIEAFNLWKQRPPGHDFMRNVLSNRDDRRKDG